MRIHKFTSTDAFVAIDLDGAETSTGPLRWARRVLQGGAKDLARSQTYTYAVLNMRHGGASGGISADSANRSEAIAAFIDEAAELVEYGTYLPDAAKGVSEADLSVLRANDPRDTTRLLGEASFVDRCDGLSAAICAHHSVGDLAGRSVAIEGFAANGPALAAAVIERGATVTAIATNAGTVRLSTGFDAQTLADVWAAKGTGLVNELGVVGGTNDVFAAAADVFFVGSKMGVVNHEVAAELSGAVAVVPCGRLPITARALAVLRRNGVAAPADFVALGGSALALWGDPSRSEAAITETVAATIETLTSEFATHDDGAFLAACAAAESFLLTWQDELPFGRPLAP